MMKNITKINSLLFGMLCITVQANLFSLPLGSKNEARGVAIQANGAIVATGFTVVNRVKQIIVARYLSADGSLDGSFGTNGVAVQVAANDQAANAVALQNDGKIVVGGYSFSNRRNQFIMVRYNPNGSLDSTFGNAGIVLTPIGTGAVIKALRIQNDNKIVVAGSAVINGNPIAILARYNPDGSLDANFGFNGIVTATFAVRSAANALVIDSNGNLVIAGMALGANQEQFVLARYQPNGIIDSTFGTGGVAITSLCSDAIAYGVALQLDGKIIASGFCGNNFIITRYDPNGFPDNAFGANGVVSNQVGGLAESTALAAQPDGKIVAVGFSDATKTVIIRYNPDGSPDLSFGIAGNGRVIIIENGDSAGLALALQSDSKIVVAGFSCNSVAIDRLNPNGTPDLSFGTSGVVLNPTGSMCPTQGASGPIIKQKTKPKR